MPSELQRVAEQLLACLNECTRATNYLHDRARKSREAAAWIGNTSHNPSARTAVMQLDEAARRCEEAAHHLSLAEARARAWVEQMDSGVRTVEPSGSSTDRRKLGPGTSTSPAERRRDEDQEEPEGSKPVRVAEDSDDTRPQEPPQIPRISNDEGWHLFGTLPIREESVISRPKTRGLWKDADGNEHQLASGQRSSDGQGDDPYYQQVKDFMREHRIGRQDADPMVASHVEAKFALFMRERGLMHETIVVNNSPCPGRFGCDQLLKLFLPPGGTLTIFGPDGFKKTYTSAMQNG
ncbi:DddA-like double-stranded DNA deaminase toxin [Kribbella sp. NPDC056951]|uniref:DddA-like double-stranded DNA deaminase toxin n=1 Tax=Kribbella sp. NPDC056951 TaxID=3345978 RepID=UPI00364323BA